MPGATGFERNFVWLIVLIAAFKTHMSQWKISQLSTPEEVHIIRFELRHFVSNFIAEHIHHREFITQILRNENSNSSNKMSKEFESLEKCLESNLPEAELAEVKRILYGKPVE